MGNSRLKRAGLLPVRIECYFSEIERFSLGVVVEKSYTSLLKDYF